MDKSKQRQRIWSGDGKKRWMRAVNNIEDKMFGRTGTVTILGYEYSVRQELDPLVADDWKIVAQIDKSI